MKNIFEYIKERVAEFKKIKPEKGVEYSVKKYRDTYKLLEEYDQKALRDPKTLADPGRIEKIIHDFSKTSGHR